MEKKNIVLSISILVSNRMDTIRNCMESLRPILEQLPSELIVVDTVGEENSDGSLAIAKEYATKVVHFDWCNDFSAARNCGLKHCSGEWFMFLDDDEWFDDVSELIEFFKSGEYKQFKSATYKIRNYHDRKGKYSVGTVQRMLRLEKETCFVERIHEYLSPMYLPSKELSCYIHHYGYAFVSEEEHTCHSERNLLLLRPEFQKNPLNMHLRVQMVQECMFLKHLESEAEDICKRTLQLEKKYMLFPEFQWIVAAYVRLAHRNNQWETALERMEEVRKKCLMGPYTKLTFAIIEIDIRKQQKQPNIITELAGEFWKTYAFLVDHPKARAEQSCLDFTVFLEDSIIADTLKNIIIAMHQTGQKEDVVLWCERRQKILKKPELSISMLVSNRMDTISNCINSLKPLLEELPSELIVVDTVGEENSDGSLAVAREYATEVVYYDWCNDFAAARNCGLERCIGEWFMFLDDDEWFEDVSELISFFKTGEYLCYASATHRMRNYTDKQGKQYNEVTLLRLVRKYKDTCFEGAIHETINNVFLPCKDFSLFSHHYGYAYADEEEKQQHIQRNFALLEEAVKRNPKDMRYRSQMALELATFDNERALQFCRETFELCKEQKKENGFQWQLSLVFRLFEALGVGTEQAEQVYKEYKYQYSFSETAENAICFQMVRIYILNGNPAGAYPYAVKYFETILWLQEHPDERQLQMTADFQRYQSDAGLQEMLRFGAYCAMNAGEYDAAWLWYSWMPWESESFDDEEAFQFMLELAAVNLDMVRLVNILKRILKNKTMMKNSMVKNRIAGVLQQLKR